MVIGNLQLEKDQAQVKKETQYVKIRLQRMELLHLRIHSAKRSKAIKISVMEVRQVQIFLKELEEELAVGLLLEERQLVLKIDTEEEERNGLIQFWEADLVGEGTLVSGV